MLRSSIAVIALLIFMLGGLVGQTVQGEARVLKSAFLGPEQWGEAARDQKQISIELQQHFAAVLAILKSQTQASLDQALERLQSLSPVAWTTEQRRQTRSDLYARRQQQLERLIQYAQRGVFPQNEGQAEQAVPIFVDEHGTHCAVGFLMHRDGWDDAVAEIVRVDNLVRVPDVDAGGLIAWLAQSGLTQAEAALIQPAYSPPQFQAALADFQTPGTVVSQYGINISNLAVQQYSYSFEHNIFDPAIELEQAFAQGLAGIAVDGVDYADATNFGIALGEGDYVSKDGPFWDNTLDQWLFVGSRFVSMGSPADGDNAIMFRFGYDVEIDGGFTDQFALTSDGSFNFNFAFSGGDMKVVTEVVAADFAEELSIQTDEEFPDILIGTELMTVERASCSVTTYALALEGASFTSLFHEFTTVPEPIHGATWLLLVMAALQRTIRVRKCG